MLGLWHAQPNHRPSFQSRQLPILVAIIEKHLDEFLRYSQAVLLRDAA
ncbi:MAG: hypothetical protein Q7T07_14105 [Burkholderiaceae bacterium]|nr:hypothetical protein [Burkholderiaceae bacterium]